MTKTNRTLMMIKPDAVKNGHIGDILQIIEASGFRIIAMKHNRLRADEAEAFYAVHNARPFFSDLVRFMSSDNIVAAVLQKENAVKDFRTLIGSTNPTEAAEGTIRKKFAESIEFNAVHGSDSDENVAIESAFHFATRELVSSSLLV